MKIFENFFERYLSRKKFIYFLLSAASVPVIFSFFRCKGEDKTAIDSSGIKIKKRKRPENVEKVTVRGTSGSRTLLKNGLIVDGTGKKAFFGDLLINKDKIETVTSRDLVFKGKTIDCSGKVIAPGIIDMHSHNDWILPINGHPELKSPFTAQGVTTFVGGNCGFGVAGFKKNSRYSDMLNARTKGLFAIEWDTMDEYFNHLRKNGITHNLANLAGFGTTRASMRGFNSDPMNRDEMKEILYLLEEAMEQGAYGVSFGLQYEPGVFATLGELKQVADVVKKKNKIITVHMKAYSSLSGTYPLKLFGRDHNLLAIEDMLNLARETGVKIQLSHLIFVGTDTWDNYEEALGLIDKAISEGVDVKFDTYAYHCGTSIINVVLPEWFLAKIPDVYNSRSSLLKLRAEFMVIEALLGFGYGDIQITKARHPELEKYNGMFLKDIAEKRNMGHFENFIDFAKKSRGRAAVLNHRYSNLEIVKELMKHPASLFMTDAHVTTEGTQNPGAFGCFPRFFQDARDYSLISLEEAVHKMTGASAERFEIIKRGVLKKGYYADIMVFDWEKVKDNNTPEKTDQKPTGIEAVFTNGRQVLAKGRVDESIEAGAVL